MCRIEKNVKGYVDGIYKERDKLDMDVLRRRVQEETTEKISKKKTLGKAMFPRSYEARERRPIPYTGLCAICTLYRKGMWTFIPIRPEIETVLERPMR